MTDQDATKKARRASAVTHRAASRDPVAAGLLLGVGNPLLDMVAYVDEAFLGKYGLKLNNAVLAEPAHLPMYEDMERSFSVEYIAGGATQNAIRVAQWMLQSPGATAFVGSVGANCTHAKKLRDVAQADGVRTLYYESPDHKTGTCAVLVHTKERSLVANLAAANAFKEAHFDTPEVKAAVERARIIYSAGFFLTLPEGPSSALRLAQHATANDKIYCLNFAAPFICQFFHDPLMSIMPHADFVFANESEAAEFGKKMGWDATDLTLVAAKVAALPKANGSHGRVVVFTQGRDPTIVFTEGQVTLYPVVPVPTDLIVDTNGAGDAFVGGFLSKLALSEDRGTPRNLDDCVRAGHYAARVIIQRSGCTMPAHPDHV